MLQTAVRRGQPFTYDLTELGEYYLEYDRMMSHWHAVLPGRVLDVQYESVVADQERETRRLLEFCGLPWEEGCLRYYETERAIRTASSEQVRRPIYDSSVGIWRNYERQLAPLIEILQPLLSRSGYDSFDYPRTDGSKKGRFMSSQKVAYAVSVALAGSHAPAILAQSQPSISTQVVVTARKREETLLDIPQEIQTISQQQLQRANLDSVKDFTRFVPSLSYNAVVPGRGTIYFRGVADDSSSFIADASAAIYLDEQPLTQSALQPEIRLIDIERIEALPGPQGTLYGSSSQAGTLRYITNKPDPTAFTTDVAVDLYTLDERRRGLRGVRRRKHPAQPHRRDPRRRLLRA